jgi:hypothetical protein
MSFIKKLQRDKDKEKENEQKPSQRNRRQNAHLFQGAKAYFKFYN